MKAIKGARMQRLEEPDGMRSFEEILAIRFNTQVFKASALETTIDLSLVSAMPGVCLISIRAVQLIDTKDLGKTSVYPMKDNMIS